MVWILRSKMKEPIKKAAALKYDMDKDSAPKVVAKGQGETAKNIIKIAEANDLPIKKDEDLVELLSKIDVDREIPTEMYKAVAEIFSFIYEMSNKRKSQKEREQRRSGLEA